MRVRVDMKVPGQPNPQIDGKNARFIEGEYDPANGIVWNAAPVAELLRDASRAALGRMGMDLRSGRVIQELPPPKQADKPKS